MAERLNKLSHDLTSHVSSAVHGVHGAGETLRGTVNSSIDGIVPNHESREGGGRARNDAVAQKGLDELHGAERHFGQREAGGGAGFTHGAEHGGEHNHRNHAAAQGGQGKWLSQGGVRADERTGYGGAVAHEEGRGGAGTAHDGSANVGLGAARQAWGGGGEQQHQQHQQGQVQPAVSDETRTQSRPLQAGAHAGAPGSTQPNALRAQALDASEQENPRREGFY
ncbi:uncharacterized protein HMPREF1541_00812 [Cyphellophora europaea CBS 101466]|uniref:Uncharacterized protein n=1 Tax=Cyphellophora europaea (strain CBS 101466) TaxID=1220924 RepID=W2SD20_CYPE1|nr:uncharacterized protein HMPREF1541_00812 [Cyphellophora europaea CBS 101466]ETN46626.1 hypothetical protein HMPREF1541_00812 [Cyphellophora europaea CBS 101466]